MDGLLNSVQRAVKAVQAKLEASQAATFGKGVSDGGCLWCQFVSLPRFGVFLSGPAVHSSVRTISDTLRPSPVRIISEVIKPCLDYLRGHQAP